MPNVHPMIGPRPPFPSDLGPAKSMDDLLWNPAMVVRVMHDNPNPKSNIVYRRFVAEWNRTKHGPGASDQKQAAALVHAFEFIGAKHVSMSEEEFAAMRA